MAKKTASSRKKPKKKSGKIVSRSITPKRKKKKKEEPDPPVREPLAIIEPAELQDLLENHRTVQMHLRTYKLCVLASDRLKERIREKYNLPERYLVNEKTGQVFASIEGE